MTVTALRRGRVTAFDDPAGLGEVTADDGGCYPFHCVAVADGSRQVALGADVVFRVRPGLHGRWEAEDLCPLR